VVGPCGDRESRGSIRAAAGAAQPAVDIYGDPLPPGATARLGTIRFRTAGEIEQLALAADGKTIAACSRAGVFLFDAIDGKRIQSIPI
jgi:hypothetical protein